MTGRQRLPLALGLLLLLPAAGRAGDVDGSWPPPAAVLDVTPAPPGETPPAPLTDCSLSRTPVPYVEVSPNV